MPIIVDLGREFEFEEFEDFPAFSDRDPDSGFKFVFCLEESVGWESVKSGKGSRITPFSVQNVVNSSNDAWKH